MAGLPAFHIVRDGILYRKEGYNGHWYQIGEEVGGGEEFTIFSNIKRGEEKKYENMLPDELFRLE